MQKGSYISPYKRNERNLYEEYSPSKVIGESKKIIETEKKLEFNKNISPSKQNKICSELAFAMEELIRSDRKSESAKVELASRTDFNLTDGFRLVDSNGKGFVTLGEFTNGLKELGINTSGKSVTLLFKRMDQDRDSRVRFSDFCVVFTSREKKQKSTLELRQPFYMHHLVDNDVYFSVKTRDVFKHTIEILMEQEQSIEIVRQRLKKSMTFNPYDGFNAMDPTGKGQVDERLLSNFLSNNMVNANEDDLKGLIEKYDRNNDGKICLSEFLDELTPKTIY